MGLLGRIRRIIGAYTMALALAASSAGGLSVAEETSEMEGVEARLVSAEAEVLDGITCLQVTGEIRNNAETSVTAVSFDLPLFDEKGRELYCFRGSYNGITKALPPGERADFALEGLRRRLDGEAASIGIRVTEVFDEAELPRAVLPERGQTLGEALGVPRLDRPEEDPPKRIRVILDQGGDTEEAVFVGVKELERASGYLAKIRIGEETDIFTTDSYNWIAVEWPDGEKLSIPLNLYSLEVSGAGRIFLYELENLDGLLDFAREKAERRR